MTLNEGKIIAQFVLVHEGIALFDALEVILIEHGNDGLDVVKVVGIEESCLEPYPSACEDCLLVCLTYGIIWKSKVAKKKSTKCQKCQIWQIILKN